MGRLVLDTLGGIDRRRPKGGPSPRVLYDLVNGYIDGAAGATQRPGTADYAQLPPGTKGLTAFDNGLVVYSHADPGTMPAGVSCEILTHPDTPGAELTRVHKAGPFMGFLYVVAEFDDGEVFHYWLQRRGPWEADTVYHLGDVVEPTVRNGFAYQCNRLGPPAVLWQPGVARALNDVVEPTEANSYYYTVTAVAGSAPKSGATEPTWPTETGATVFEDTDLAQPVNPGTGGVIDPSRLPDDLRDRYENMGGTLIRVINR